VNGIEQPKNMPKEITLDDGTIETVYTKDEVSGLQAGSDKNKERKEALSNLNKSLDLKEGQSLEDRVSEMKETSNPNFAKYRTKFKAMEKALSEDGKKFDDNGSLIEVNQPLSSEELQKQIDDKVKETVNNVTNTASRDQALSKFSEEDQKVMRPHFDKLMNLYPNDLEDNILMAAQKAFPEDNSNAIRETMSNAGGSNPRINADGSKEKFTQSDEGKTMLSDILPPAVKKAIADKENNK